MKYHTQNVANGLGTMLGLGIWFLVSVGPLQTQARQLKVSEAELANDASTIVIGKVEASTSHWSSDGSVILTDHRIILSEKLKGGGTDTAIVAQTLGGEVGDVGLHVSDQAAMSVGDEVILFLTSDASGRYSVVAGEQGARHVINGMIKETGESLSAARSRIAEVVKSATERSADR